MTTPWHFWIDTGGTFTDCLARDPAGRMHRAKVLSSSALRGRIVAASDHGAIRVDAAWAGCDDLVRGFAFRVLGARDRGDGEPPRRVVAFDAAAGVLELDGACPRDARPASRFEVVSDEPAPLLAARLVTGTPAGTALPPARMRLATTRG